MHSATGAAPGSQEFGDAYPTDGPPHAAVNQATPSRVWNGDSGTAASATAEDVDDGATAGWSVPQPASTDTKPTATRNAARPRPRHVADMPYILRPRRESLAL